MKATIHDKTVLNAGRKDRTDLEIKKPYGVSQCSKFMNGIDRANTLVITQISGKLSDR